MNLRVDSIVLRSAVPARDLGHPVRWFASHPV